MRYPKEETLQQLIYRELIAQIARGGLLPGSEIPSIRELMKIYGAGRNTVQLVLKRLEREKIIFTRSCRRAKVNDNLLPRVALITSGAVTWDRFRYSYGAWGFEIGQAVYYALRERGFLPIFLPVPFDRNHWQKLVSGAVIFNYVKSLPEDPDSNSSYGRRPLLQISGSDFSECTRLYFDRGPGMLALANYFTVHDVHSIGLLGNFSGTNLGLAIDEILLPALQIHRRMPIYRIACDITEEAGWLAMQQLLERSPKLPLGIFAAGDFAAKGAIKYALASGLKLKKDLLITGCTGLAESGAWHPPLSVLTTPFQRIGSLTAGLITQLSKGQKLPEYITVDSRLIIRGS